MDIKNWRPASESEVMDFVGKVRFLSKSSYQIIYLTYILYLQKLYDTEGKMTLTQLIELGSKKSLSELEYILKDNVTEEMWNCVKDSGNEFSLQVLETVILDTTGKYTTSVYEDNKGLYSTPDTLTGLVVRLLDIQPKEKVFDICGGIGNFLVKAYMNQPNADLYNKEINYKYAAVMMIRARVLEGVEPVKFHTEIGNALSAFNKDVVEKSGPYDKIFSNHPWRFDSPSNELKSSAAFKELKKNIPGIDAASVSDWLFNYLMLTQLKETGKAISIMLNGSTWNLISGCKNARKYFLENGLVEAVIALPPRLFDFTTISTTLIVFSHGNTHVRMVDASEMCTENRRQNIFTAQDIENIVAACNEDSSHSVLVDTKKILEDSNAVIHPSRYLVNDKPIKDGVALGTVLQEIRRGAPINAQELDKLITDTPTNYQYVMLKQVNNGMIDKDLPYLRELPAKYEKFLIPNHGIILSKTGAPFKCAIVDTNTEHQILANGNVFILQVDEEKVNPYYLKALFESAYGTGLLLSICTGSVIRNFTKGALEKLIVPIPPMEKQNYIANKYLAIQDEIQIYQKRLESAYERKVSIFDELQEE